MDQDKRLLPVHSANFECSARVSQGCHHLQRYHCSEALWEGHRCRWGRWGIAEDKRTGNPLRTGKRCSRDGRGVSTCGRQRGAQQSPAQAPGSPAQRPCGPQRSACPQSAPRSWPPTQMQGNLTCCTQATAAIKVRTEALLQSEVSLLYTKQLYFARSVCTSEALQVPRSDAAA